MRAFTIKHRGATIWQNMSMDRELTFSDNEKVYAGLLFYRKKDATKYLNTFEHKRFFEVIGVTIDKSKKDNRKKYASVRSNPQRKGKKVFLP